MQCIILQFDLYFEVQIYYFPVVRLWINTAYARFLVNTRSSAVAERPRDASCLSVVSFNIPTAQFLLCDAMHKRGYCRHAVSICPVRLSVCLTVTFVSCAKTNKDIFEIFSPSGSDTNLVFPYQTGWRYSDGNPPNGGVECKGGMKNPAFRPLFSPISHCISETVIVRWAHAARQFISIEFLSIRTPFSVIARGSSPRETKMW